tara:strand:+ start:75 stop:2486 length:2412 start_codon:yes stop_codon:yes gene_type:complete
MKKSQLRKIIRESIKGLLTEQVTTCQQPILIRCSHNTAGGNVSGAQGCRVYVDGLGTPSCIRINNSTLNHPYAQIGDCFKWSGNSMVECVVGYNGTVGQQHFKYAAACDDCVSGTGNPAGSWPGNSNVSPPYNCNDMSSCATWNADHFECSGTPNYNCNQIIPSNANYNTLTSNGTNIIDFATCTANCVAPQGIPGCTDITATNYDPIATVDDGSCTYDVYGCTDSLANNYNSLANVDDGSCTYDVYGCTDSTATNYDPLANVDDGSCITAINGCTDSTAFNYDPLANVDDGSCYPVILGCTNPLAINFIPLIPDVLIDVNTDDGSCQLPSVGCTDPLACNYNNQANTDDGTCELPGTCEICDPNATVSPFTMADPTCYGCTDSLAVNYDPLATIDDGSCIYGYSIYACLCSIWQNNGGACPSNGTGTNYITTQQHTTIGGNQANLGDTFMPWSNSNFIVDLLDLPTQTGIQTYSPGGPCNPLTPPTTYDCYPGQGCQPNLSGTGQYSGGTTATNLADCNLACQTTYDCDGAPNYNCSTNYQGTGTYNSLSACQNNCQPPIPNTYDCDQNYQCQLNPQGTGTYNSLSACQQQCQPPVTTHIECHKCENGNPIANMFTNPPGCDNTAGWYTVPTFNAHDCKPPKDIGCYKCENGYPIANMFTNPPGCDNTAGWYTYFTFNSHDCKPPPPTEIRCECCDKTNTGPVTMNQLFPQGFNCTTLNDPTIGLFNCDVSPISGGPGAINCNPGEPCEYFNTNYTQQDQDTYCEICNSSATTVGMAALYCDCCPNKTLQERFQKLANIKKK